MNVDVLQDSIAAMLLFSLPIVAIFILTGCNAKIANETQHFPNVIYLGMGYDVIKGNPDDNYNDPGFRFGVVDLSWEDNVITSDGKYMVPDDVQALQVRSCGYQNLVSTVFGTKSYQKSLSDDVTHEENGIFRMRHSSSIWGARFSASTAYRQVRQGTRSYRRVYLTAKAKCIEYELSLNYLQSPLKVTDSFVQAVKKLSTDNSDEYSRFISTYGTHVTVRVTMGAKMVIRSEFEQEAWRHMKQDGVNVAHAVQLSFAHSASFGTEAETESESKERHAFESVRRSYTASYRGSRPPSDGRWETWVHSTGNSPSPIAYELIPLTYFFNDDVYKSPTPSSLSTKRALLQAALDEYCDKLPGCEVPEQDPVVINATANFRRSPSTLYCPPTYKLVSCGISSIPKNPNKTLCDVRQYAIPVSDTECECSDENGGKCVSWCAASGLNFNITSSPQFHGRINVSCPRGYKVGQLHRIYFYKYLTIVSNGDQVTHPKFHRS